MQKKLQFFHVEDDMDDQEFFCMALQEINPKITYISAKDGHLALEYVNDNKLFKPDFVFLDLNMPKLGGKDCLKKLKKMERFNSTPIYILTTSSSAIEKEELLKIGATDFITKPICIGDLIKILSEIILTKQVITE